jgi:hypothetical protein
MGLSAIAQCYYMTGTVCIQFVDAVNVDDKYRLLYRSSLRIIKK